MVAPQEDSESSTPVSATHTTPPAVGGQDFALLSPGEGVGGGEAPSEASDSIVVSWLPVTCGSGGQTRPGQGCVTLPKGYC